MEIRNKSAAFAYYVSERSFFGGNNMRRMIPGPGKGGRIYLEVAFAAFGLGIFLTFFLSARILVLIEAVLIIAAAGLCFYDR